MGFKSLNFYLATHEIGAVAGCYRKCRRDKGQSWLRILRTLGKTFTFEGQQWGEKNCWRFSLISILQYQVHRATAITIVVVNLDDYHNHHHLILIKYLFSLLFYVPC